jgi:hypothetical protein
MYFVVHFNECNVNVKKMHDSPYDEFWLDLGIHVGFQRFAFH